MIATDYAPTPNPELASSTAGRVLASFLNEHKLPLRQAAAALGCSTTGLHNWIHGTTSPETYWREAIERWTGGHVPASLWETPEERAALLAIVPHVAPGSPAAPEERDPPPPDSARVELCRDRADDDAWELFRIFAAGLAPHLPITNDPTDRTGRLAGQLSAAAFTFAETFEATRIARQRKDTR